MGKKKKFEEKKMVMRRKVKEYFRRLNKKIRKLQHFEKLKFSFTNTLKTLQDW